LLAHDGTLAVEGHEEGNLLQVSGIMPLAVHLPAQGEVSLQNCTGDVLVAAVKSLELAQHCGDVAVNQVRNAKVDAVNGDVTVQAGHSLQVATLVGDLAVRRMEGEVTAGNVNGDVLAQGITGRLALDGVKGDVTVREAAGGVEAHNITGDLEFWGNLQQGHYTLENHGDLRILLDAASSVSLDLEAPGGDVQCDLEVLGGERSKHRFSGSLGQGTAVLKATAHRGSILVRAKPSDDLRRRMEKDWEHAEARAALLERRAQLVMEKARLRGERLAEKVRVRSSRQIQWHSPRGTPATLKRNLDEERLAVLKMLSQGKINAEQAESLLKAMEE